VGKQYIYSRESINTVIALTNSLAWDMSFFLRGESSEQKKGGSPVEQRWTPGEDLERLPRGPSPTNPTFFAPQPGNKKKPPHGPQDGKTPSPGPHQRRVIFQVRQAGSKEKKGGGPAGQGRKKSKTHDQKKVVSLARRRLWSKKTATSQKKGPGCSTDHGEMGPRRAGVKKPQATLNQERGNAKWKPGKRKVPRGGLCRSSNEGTLLNEETRSEREGGGAKTLREGTETRPRDFKKAQAQTGGKSSKRPGNDSKKEGLRGKPTKRQG